MSEWTKNGSYPQQFTDKSKVWRDSQGYSYTNVVGDDSRLETLFGYTQAPERPSFDPNTEFLSWDGEDWVVSEQPPPEPSIPEPHRVSKIDFSRLFTLEQRVALETLKQQANAADLTDPIQAVQFGPVRVMFENFNLPLEFIELDHPDTVAAFNQILVPAGVVTQAEANRILAGTPPNGSE